MSHKYQRRDGTLADAPKIGDRLGLNVNPIYQPMARLSGEGAHTNQDYKARDDIDVIVVGHQMSANGYLLLKVVPKAAGDPNRPESMPDPQNPPRGCVTIDKDIRGLSQPAVYDVSKVMLIRCNEGRITTLANAGFGPPVINVNTEKFRARFAVAVDEAQRIQRANHTNDALPSLQHVMPFFKERPAGLYPPPKSATLHDFTTTSAVNHILSPLDSRPTVVKAAAPQPQRPRLRF